MTRNQAALDSARNNVNQAQPQSYRNIPQDISPLDQPQLDPEHDPLPFLQKIEENERLIQEMLAKITNRNNRQWEHI